MLPRQSLVYKQGNQSTGKIRNLSKFTEVINRIRTLVEWPKDPLFNFCTTGNFWLHKRMLQKCKSRLVQNLKALSRGTAMHTLVGLSLHSTIMILRKGLRKEKRHICFHFEKQEIVHSTAMNQASLVFCIPHSPAGPWPWFLGSYTILTFQIEPPCKMATSTIILKAVLPFLQSSVYSQS